MFAVKGRQNLIPKQHREELDKYITGIVQKRFYGNFGFVRDIKTASSQFINENGFMANLVGKKDTEPLLIPEPN